MAVEAHPRRRKQEAEQEEDEGHPKLGDRIVIFGHREGGRGRMRRRRSAITTAAAASGKGEDDEMVRANEEQRGDKGTGDVLELGPRCSGDMRVQLAVEGRGATGGGPCIIATMPWQWRAGMSGEPCGRFLSGGVKKF